MTQFTAINERAEVSGETILSIVIGMGTLRTKAYQILNENGITDPKPGGWYLQQLWLNCLKIILKAYHPITLVSIGRKIPENAMFPPDINSIEKALKSIDIAYHMNHRIDNVSLFDPSTGMLREGIGHYSYRGLSPNRAEVVCDNPYPCDFDKGIVDEMAFMYKPAASTTIKVRHAETGVCRKLGGDACTYIVEW